MTTDPISDVRNHVLHSQQYFENAGIMVEQLEAAKAGEFLWGSLAQAIHALASYKHLDSSVNTHRGLKNFTIQLARDLGDESIVDDFVLAESLHFNFYVVEKEIEDILLVLRAVERLRRKVLSLIPPELLEQGSGV